jgi:hypothetical protein
VDIGQASVDCCLLLAGLQVSEGAHPFPMVSSHWKDATREYLPPHQLRLLREPPHTPLSAGCLDTAMFSPGSGAGQEAAAVMVTVAQDLAFESQ